MQWDKKLPWYWNNPQTRILGPARTETPAGPEEIRPQLPPRKGTADPWAGSDDGPTLTVSQKPSRTAPCSLTNEKSRRRWIILALLSYRSVQYIYSTLNIKTYLFSLVAHKLFPLTSCLSPIRTETSGNSSFPYEYRILQFEKVLKSNMYPILTGPQGKESEEVLLRGVCWVGRKESMQ